MNIYKNESNSFTSKMKVKLKIHENIRNNQFNISIPRKKIDELLRANKGKSPKWLSINTKNIEW